MTKKKVRETQGDMPSPHDADDTGQKLRGTPFKAGAEWAGNSAGRPKGSRNKLSEDFLHDLHVAWGDHGPAALKAAAQEKPAEFCKIVAGLLPKEFKLKNEFSEFTDEQLDALNVLAASLIGDAAGTQIEDRSRKGTKTVN